MTTPSPASSAITRSARTDCDVCACKEQQATGRRRACNVAVQWLRRTVSLRVFCLRSTSFPRLVLRPFLSRFSHFALTRRNIFCELIFALAKKETVRLYLLHHPFPRSHGIPLHATSPPHSAKRKFLSSGVLQFMLR